ncbi:hypothetical protein BLNAU_13031 [Blattamonas nauphoetae]|uniref:Uncharacterized protein n=1 Tax=Blattamonas nauphoetae TaxID=2049346 RepID=A0ABQ9XKQ2_9EUKA|nr:hypothetical protein BLNAU_13031 [Blattamonas nauphoetae]
MSNHSRDKNIFIPFETVQTVAKEQFKSNITLDTVSQFMSVCPDLIQLDTKDRVKILPLDSTHQQSTSNSIPLTTNKHEVYQQAFHQKLYAIVETAFRKDLGDNTPETKEAIETFNKAVDSKIPAITGVHIPSEKKQKRSGESTTKRLTDTLFKTHKRGNTEEGFYQSLIAGINTVYIQESDKESHYLKNRTITPAQLLDKNSTERKNPISINFEQCVGRVLSGTPSLSKEFVTDTLKSLASSSPSYVTLDGPVENRTITFHRPLTLDAFTPPPPS